MAVYIVTGKLGGGKTIISVKRIRDYLEKASIVATNLDVNLEHLISPFNKTARVIRVPDKPSAHDLAMIGSGNLEYDEEKNGLLVLDECGTWFNSRAWNDKARTPVNDWFLHARKLGWDVILIIQDVENLDSQARRSIAEHTVFCRRTDRFGIPFLGTAFKLLTGSRLKLPQAHIGRVVYGISQTDMLVDRWATRGNGLYRAYDTKQTFLESYSHGTHSILPPWHRFGRYMAPRDWRFYMRLTRIYFKRFRIPLALGTGMLVGSSMAVAAVFAANYDPDPDPVQVVVQDPVQVKEPGNQKHQVFSPLGKRANRLKIVGTWSAGSEYAYNLAYAVKDQEGKFAGYENLTSTDLESLGYQVEPVGDCGLVLHWQETPTPVYCF